MENPEPRKPHWSEIDRTRPWSGSLSSTPTRRRPKGRSGIRLAVICAAGLIAIGVLSFLALDYVGAFSSDEVPEDLQRLTGQIVREDEARRVAEAEATLTERVHAWNALLASIASTGEDKTEELMTFLHGPADDLAQAAADYQEAWSPPEGEQDTASVVPDSMAIERISIAPGATLASVIITEEVRSPGGLRSRCVEMTTWILNGDLWCRTTETMPHCSGGNVRRPIDQATQIDGLVWAVEKIQDYPAAAPVDTLNSYVTLTFHVRNQDLLARWADDYTVRIWGPEGWFAEVSPATIEVLPGAIEQLHYSLADDEHRSFTVVYEVKAGVDLAQLEYEVVPASSPSGNDPLSVPATVPPNDLLDQQIVEPGTPHAWALATSALLCHLNGGRDDLLGVHEATAENARLEQQGLAEWWGINSRDDLFTSLDWIDRGGHRQMWEEIAAYLSSLSEDELQELLTEVAKDYDTKHQVDMVRKHAAALGSKSLLGWDYCRFIYLCRVGYVSGYLSEEEAWDLIMPVAMMLQKTFASWEEIGENYLIGREFWSYEQMQRDGVTIQRVYEILLGSPSSPWKLNPWDMDLGVIPDLTV